MLPWRPIALGTAAVVLAMLVSAVLGGALPGGAAAADTPRLPPLDLGPIAPPLPGQPSEPSQDPFYRPPHDLAGADPGDLLRYRASRVQLAPGGVASAPVRAWQVLYRSSTAGDRPDAVSGTVLVPETPWTGPGPRPIVSYTVGTHGLGDQCAPSYQLASGTEFEYTVFELALVRGWAVAVTDYEGLGTPGEHTYAVAVTEGRAALDIARAAMRVPGAGLSEHAPVALWGYSQGGGAAASAGEQARHYAPELRTVGVAEGGVPSDLRAVLAGVDGGAGFALLAGATAGFDTAYPRIGIHDLLNADGRRLLDQIRHECAAQFATHAGHHLDEYTRIPGLLNFPPVVHAMARNRIGGTAPDMPVLLYRAQLDELIPASVSQAQLAEYCARGVRIRYTEVPAATHIPGGSLGAPAAVTWLADRFAGHPAPTSCH